MADLISIETYKQAKALISAKEDSRLSIIVPAVSQLVKAYCNNSFNDYLDAESPCIEEISVNNTTKKIQLSQWPVLTVEKIEARDYYDADYVELTLEEYILEKKNDCITRIGRNWEIGVNSVIVTYTAGYDPLPEDLTLAVIDLIHYYYKEEYKPDRSISGAAIRNAHSSSHWNSTGFPDHIRRVLDMYRMF
jgi:hypothetical protein